jgi:hypothetical protein
MSRRVLLTSRYLGARYCCVLLRCSRLRLSCSTVESAPLQAAPSHGRGHMFDPCITHQLRHLWVPLSFAVCADRQARESIQFSFARSRFNGSPGVACGQFSWTCPTHATMTWLRTRPGGVRTRERFLGILARSAGARRAAVTPTGTAAYTRAMTCPMPSRVHGTRRSLPFAAQCGCAAAAFRRRFAHRRTAAHS